VKKTTYITVASSPIVARRTTQEVAIPTSLKNIKCICLDRLEATNFSRYCTAAVLYKL